MANVAAGVYGLLGPFYMSLEAYMEIIFEIVLAGGSFYMSIGQKYFQNLHAHENLRVPC